MKNSTILLRLLITSVFCSLSFSNEIVSDLADTEKTNKKVGYDWKDPAYFFQSIKTLVSIAPRNEKARITLIHKNFNGYNRNRYILNITSSDVEKALNIDLNTVIEDLSEEALHFILCANLENSPLQKKALNVIEKLVENNNPKAQYILGELYFEGNLLNPEEGNSQLEIEEKNRKCRELFYLAATQGLVVAQYNYGTLYEWDSGFGLDTDPDEEFKWVKLAAKNGSSEAQYHMGNMYLWGHERAPQNNFKAIKWYERGAKEGDLNCLVELKNLSPILANQISDEIKSRKDYSKFI